MGDRWDAWVADQNIGNEVFSPYSSPNTKDRNNSNTGIFVYYESINGNSANLNIYKDENYGGSMTESDILELTPPSRPMGLTINLSECVNYIQHPILSWNHNMEPDMVRSGNPDFKRYKIYRATSADTTEPPVIYIYIGSVDIPVNSAPTFTDNGIDIVCGSSSDPDWRFYTRYKVSALDNTEWESVKSDFESIKAHSLNKDNLISENNNPTRFELSQNFPNPFNPSTEIKYSIPVNAYVTITVYNLLGEEVSRLINNEFKTTGYYSIQFNGANFASGVYFYRIEAGNYISTKKMVLIK
jgi:hypothetical protein